MSLPVWYSIRMKDSSGPDGYLYMNDFDAHTYVFNAEDAVAAFNQVKKDGNLGVEIHRLVESELRSAELI